MRRRSLLTASPLVALITACTPRQEKSSQPNLGSQTSSPTQADKDLSDSYQMPSEEGTHQGTWIAYVANPDIWGKELAPLVKQNLAALAHTIARYEAVHILVSPEDSLEAQGIFANSPRITLHEVDLDDLWIRDSGPVFIHDSDGKVCGIDFNFNGWGNKQNHSYDALVAQKVIALAQCQFVKSSLVLEGGSLEVDGAGSIILSESSILNDNRNPGVTKESIEEELGRLLGVQNFIWIPGVKGKDITDGHTDFYARFAGQNTILASIDNDPTSFDYAVTRANIEALKAAKTPDGELYTVIELPSPQNIRDEYLTDDFAAGYINYYICNGAIIMPEFGDEQADEFARTTLAELFPQHDIIQLNIDGIAAGGGGIHCATQQQV